jgi:glutaredoxin
MVKEFLSQKGIKYVVKDISQDVEAYKELVTKYRSMGTPTTIIGDQVIIGFGRQKLEKALGL